MRKLFFLCVCFIVACTHPARKVTPQTPWQVINDDFRQIYKAQRNQMVAQDKGPLLVLLWGDLYLFENSQALKKAESSYLEKINLAPPIFELYKSASHIPLTIMLLNSQSQYKAHYKKLLLDLKSRLPQAIDEIVQNDSLLPKMPKDEQRAVRVMEMVEDALKELNQSEISKQYFANQKSSILKNVYFASYAQLLHLQMVLQTWVKSHSDLNWQEAKLLLFGRQTPRAGSLLMQFFSHFLPDADRRYLIYENDKNHNLKMLNSSDKVIYAEYFGIPETETFMQAGLQLYGTHLLDAEIGRVLFNDRQKMFSDLLADSAKKILRQKLYRHPPTS